MTYQTPVLELPGAQELIDWFGTWPSFHDAEVVGIELNRANSSRLAVHFFRITGSINERGHYITEKHAIISLILEDITDLELAGFNHQNVLSSLSIVPIGEAYEIELGACYGVSGRIVARSMSFELQPGMPTQSVYAEAT